MVKKLQKNTGEKQPSGAQMAGAVKDSAQQIWLAGLGAFSKAQAEGGKVFESLVKEGLTMQRNNQIAAQDRIAQAASRMAGMADMASQAGTRAVGQWDKLETIFEDRVAKSLAKLGVPTAGDLEALTIRIDALVELLSKTSVKPATAAPPQTAAKRSVATRRNAVAKKLPARKVAPKASPKAVPKAAQKTETGVDAAPVKREKAPIRATRSTARSDKSR